MCYLKVNITGLKYTIIELIQNLLLCTTYMFTLLYDKFGSKCGVKDRLVDLLHVPRVLVASKGTRGTKSQNAIGVQITSIGAQGECYINLCYGLGIFGRIIRII
jgi:hypothetical protein